MLFAKGKIFLKRLVEVVSSLGIQIYAIQVKLDRNWERVLKMMGLLYILAWQLLLFEVHSFIMLRQHFTSEIFIVYVAILLLGY